MGRATMYSVHSEVIIHPREGTVSNCPALAPFRDLKDPHSTVERVRDDPLLGLAIHDEINESNWPDPPPNHGELVPRGLPT